MNNLNKKLNNLKELIKDLEDKKRVIKGTEWNDDFIFAVDNELSGYYMKFIRIIDVKDFKVYSNAFEINDYNMNISNNMVDFKNKKFYIVATKNKEQGYLYTFRDNIEKNMEPKILNILFNTKGTKKDFKELNADFLLIFNHNNPSFFNYVNIEKLLMEHQLKNF